MVGVTIALATDELDPNIKIPMALVKFGDREIWFSNHYGNCFTPEYLGEVVNVSEDFDGLYITPYRKNNGD